MNVNEKIASIEHGLRYRVQIKGKPDIKMDLLDRMAYYKIPGLSLALINNGVIEWSKAYGFISTDNNKPITTDTLFQAASISKLVTAIGVLKLVQEGKLSLDQDVNHYLKNWSVPENEFTKTEKVTLRRLLSHSSGTSVSGFPGYAVGKKLPTLLQILDGEPPANTEPVRVVMTPGSKFQYSGGGTSIVQLVIEEQTNMPFQKWMKEQILDPFGMRNSTYEQPLPANTASLAAHGTLATGKVLGNYHVYPEMAAAGLWTTPSDLARLAIAIQSIFKNDSDGLLNASSVKEMLTSQILIYGDLHAGLGVFLQKKTNNMIFEHSGLNEGFSARLYMLSEKGQGVVMMVNGDVKGFYFLEELINSIGDVYDWPNVAPVQRTAIFLDLERYRKIIGKYYSTSDLEGFAEIYNIEDRFFLKPYPTAPAMELFLEAEDQFFTQEENQTIYFKGGVSGCKLIINFDDNQIWGQRMSYHKPPTAVF